MLTSDQREEVAKHFNIVTGGKKKTTCLSVWMGVCVNDSHELDSRATNVFEKVNDCVPE